jgi:L-lactate dehydrogenase complex protein LldF
MSLVDRGLIEKFKKEATNAHAIVFEAADTQDACNYVLELARKHSVKRAVKSKSNLFEKLELRKHLEKADIEVKETDIESWIAQLAGKQPVHMSNPDSPKTIEQLAALISIETGEDVKPDPLEVIKAARLALRPLFVDADLGITEADMAVAESGTLIITENEGNGRLVAMLPRVHLTILDTETLVSSVKEATVKLKARRQNATDPGDPHYVTYISGRNSTGDIPNARNIRAQGPEEEYILIINKA